MHNSIVVGFRTLVVLTFLLIMPVLALPAVGRWFDSALQGGQTHAPKPKNVAVNRPSDNAPLAEPENLSSFPSPNDSPPVDMPDAAFASPIERSEYIQQRLIGMGANYMRLERLDQHEQPAFRFHCQMGIAGSAAYNRPFEVTDPDPLLAMERVLADVETWQSARIESDMPENQKRILR
jgi:hypothetical protein